MISSTTMSQLQLAILIKFRTGNFIVQNNVLFKSANKLKSKLSNINRTRDINLVGLKSYNDIKL